MFEVKFSPGIARLRELMQEDVKLAEGVDILLDRLHGLHLPDDQLFASLLFYTKQGLWKESCAMYRALNSPTYITPEMFVHLIERLHLTHMYNKVCHLPPSVCVHLISMILNKCNISSGNSLVLESIARTIMDDYSNTNRVSVLVLHCLITRGRLPLPLLLDSLYWLTGGDMPIVNSALVTQFINCSVRRSVQRCTTVHKECTVESADELDTSTAVQECIDIISKQYSSESTIDLKHLVTDLVNQVSDDRNYDVSALCRSCHQLRRRLNGFCQAFPQASKQDVQWVEEALSAAEERLLHHDLFMSTVVCKAATTNDASSMQLISTQILSYLTNASVRDLLLTHYETIRWTEGQVRRLLNTLSSETVGPASVYLQMIIVDGLSKLPAGSCLLTYEYLHPLSSCFSEVQCQVKTNLLLNKISPQNSDKQTSCTLSILLSISPYHVLKRVTDQVLISQGSLATAMSKVYVSMLSISKLPTDVYDLHVEAMNLSGEQWSNILFKCLLYLPLHDSPVPGHLLNQCMEKITLDNPHLLHMLANVESVSTSDADSLDPSWLSTISLFSLSILDSELSPSGGVCPIKVGQVMRLLSSQPMMAAIAGVDKSTLNAVLQSLHENTLEHLRADNSMRHLFLP